MPTIRRIALDQRKVFGREHDRAKQPQRVTRARHRRAVDAGPICLAWIDFQLDEQRPPVAHDLAANNCARCTAAYQRRIASDAVTALCREIPDGLDQVRLALTVRTDKRGDPGVERQFYRGVRPEVDQ